MKRSKIKIIIEVDVTIPVQSGQEDLFEEVVDEIERGCPSMWVQEAVMESIAWDELEIVNIERDDELFSPEEELDFSE